MRVKMTGWKWMGMVGMLLVGRLAFAAPLTLDDSGRAVELREDGELEIILKGNPTTGYSWSVEKYAADILRPVGEPEYTPDSNLIGSGGTYRYVFKAVAAGTTPLTLIYHRSWETNTPPETTFGVMVNVLAPEHP